MKKIYLLTMSFFAAFSVVAQTQIDPNERIIVGDQSSFINKIAEPDNSVPAFQHKSNGSLAAAGDVLFSSTFDTISKWTAQNNGTARGWQIGSTQHPWYSNQGIASTSGADWAALKPGDPRAGALSAAQFNLTSTPINCSGRNSVILEFQQRYVRFEDTALVQVSTDGTNYTTVYDNFWLPLTTSASSNPSANPVDVTVNITKIAANQPNVYVRFRWISRQQVQPGIGYGWWIDDVKVSEGETNDMAMNEAYWKPFTDSTYIHYSQFYTQIPNKQARKYPLLFGAKYSNVGSAAQSNAGYNVNVSGPAGFSATASATQTLLAAGDDDSASTTTAITLSGGTGNYNVELEATSDSTLKQLGDDKITQTIAVSNDVYARDANDTVNAAAFYYNPSGVWEWELGALFEIKETDTVVAVEWCNTASNKRNPNKLGKISAHIYNGGNYTRNSIGVPASAPIFSSQSIDIKDLRNDSPGANNWVRTPVSRVAGGTIDTIGAGNYIVTIRGDQIFGSDTIFWPVERTDLVRTQYFGRLAQSGSSTMGQWFLGSRKIMIRLITRPTTCPTLVGAVATGKATTACGNTDGEVEVTTDPTNGAGPFTYAWDINGNVNTNKKVTGLGSGSYDVTITDANGCSVTTNASVSDFGAPQVTLDNANSTLTTTCFGQKQGSIKVNITPGANPNPNYTFKWFETGNSANTFSGDSLAANLEAGNYTVEVNDGSTPPCIQSLQVVITGPSSGISAQVGSSLDNDCKGDVKGEVELVLSGGNGNLTISWSDGSTDTKRTGLAAGTYNYTVTDAQGCTLTGNHRVLEPSNPFTIVTPRYNADITPTTSGITEVDAKNVELEVKVSGGSLASTTPVEWRNPLGQIIFGENSSKLKVGTDEKSDRNGAGEYTAIATSSLGCKSPSMIFKVFETDALFPMNVSEFGTKSTLNVFPNPAHSSLNVELNNIGGGTYTVELQNVIGQTIFSRSFDSNGSIETSFDLNDTDAGVYFLNISNGTDEVSKKIVVE